MISIKLPVFLFTQKFISSTDLDKNMSSFLFLISIRMVLQRQNPKALLHLCEIRCRRTLQQLVRIFAKLQLVQFFFQSLHLLYIIVLQMSLHKLYNEVINYFWAEDDNKSQSEAPETEDTPHISRINRLSIILKETNYSEVQKQQICMFYSNLIKEYPSARSSLSFPKFLYQPPLYTPKICFYLTLSVSNSKIYCILQLAIIFSQKLSQEMPAFYIKNPNYTKYKPNKHYVKFSNHQQTKKYYEAVLGGLKVLMPQVSSQRWSWTSGSYFKEQNVLNMVKWIHKQLLLDQFPFAARKNEQIDSIQTQVNALNKFLAQNLQPTGIFQQARLLKSIQQLSVLLRSIDLETIQLNEGIKLMKLMEEQSKQSTEINEYFPKAKNEQSQNILASISSLQALKDTIYFLESKFNQKQLILQQFLSFSSKAFAQQFDERAKISKIKYEVL